MIIKYLVYIYFNSVDILRQRTQDVSLKKHAIKVLEASHSFEYTRCKIQELEREAREEIERLGGNESLLKYLRYLEMT
jgi:geranylgeranyl diphosphate synthase type 3